MELRQASINSFITALESAPHVKIRVSWCCFLVVDCGGRRSEVRELKLPTLTREVGFYLCYLASQKASLYIWWIQEIQP